MTAMKKNMEAAAKGLAIEALHIEGTMGPEAAIPMIIIYPFIQKHFVKGVMVGSAKG